ncbi:hypothetical protein IMCC3317_02000 [Kordia antarctica]|uniref:Uncharacterized protein n=1 Tax=Kordia antarctica TaxID=1218801 RepID=A0A7L4ZDW7_9FLAO|nr:hypothetical protein [Kordia antarctica]QHI34855.1 hypothetical protein IMCC3317_02000 [Kordia antarctica]
MIVVLNETIKEIIMKKTYVSSILLFFILCTCVAETNEYSYLKIILNNQETISYPPGTSFIAQDVQGNTVLSPDDLEQLKIYNIVQPITLFVFVSWNDEPDVHELKSGKLVLGKTNRSYKKSSPKKDKTPPKDHFSRPTDGDYARSIKNEKSNKKKNHKVYITKERYFSYDEKTGYNASLEFSNGVVFYYRDGKATAWQDGNVLDIKGKYLVKTADGLFKISYRPKTKEMWWVFEKDK